MEEEKVVHLPRLFETPEQRASFLNREIHDIVLVVLTAASLYMAWIGIGEARAVVLTAFVFSLGVLAGRHGRVQ